MAEGFQIGKGYIEAEVVIDESKVNKAAMTAGDKAGSGFAQSFAKQTESFRSRLSASFGMMGGESGNSFAESFKSKYEGLKKHTDSFGSKLSGIFKNAGDKAGDFFSNSFTDKAGVALKGVGSQMGAVLLPAAVALGPLLGAALGAGITAALGGGVLALGIMQAMKNEETEKAGKMFRNKIFGLSKEDEAKAKKELKESENRLMKYQDALHSATSESDKKMWQDRVNGVKDSIKETEETLGYVDNNMFSRATKGFQEPLQKGFEQATAFFLKLEPQIKRIFDAAVPLMGVIGKGLGEGLKKMLPGIENLMKKMTPIFDVIGKGAERIGAAIGRMFNKFASDPEVMEGMSMALGDLIGLLETLINYTGDFVVSTSKAYAQFKKAWGEVANWFTGTIVPSLSRAWGQLKGAISAVGKWFTETLVPSWQRAWGQLKGAGQAVTNWFGGLPKWFSDRWASIKGTFNSAITSIRDNISNRVNSIKGYFTGLRDSIGNVFNNIKDKFTAFKDNAIRMFQLARDGIGKAWDGIKDKTKGPVNFVIDPVYKNLRDMWNKAAKVLPGVGEMPEVKKFAKGGYVPGQGSRDTVPAMLTPGEGVLTKKEIAMLGGAAGFKKFRDQLQYYNDGGIVGGIKDWVGGKLKAGKDKILGLARGALYPPAKFLADKFIYPQLNKMAGSGFANLPKQAGLGLLGKALAYLKNDDAKNPAGNGTLPLGSGMKYQAMMKILRQQFPGLPLISGYRPGSRTLSGNKSYHSAGRAVDLPPRKDVAAWIYQNFKSKTKELITPYQQYNLHNGNKHRYTGAIWNQHNFAGGNAHDHWAMDRSGVLPPKSTTLVTNATREREYAMTEDKLKKLAGNVINVSPGGIVLDISKYRNIDEVLDAVTGFAQSLEAGIQQYG